MPHELPFDPSSFKVREALAMLAHERLVHELAAAQREHDLTAEDLYFVGWNGLSDKQRHPYRCAVSVVLDALEPGAL